MSKSDDYIIITESHDLDKGPILSDTEVHEETADASLRALEKQGISVLGGGEERPIKDEPLDQFSRELMDEGGIEIVSADEEEESFL